MEKQHEVILNLHLETVDLKRSLRAHELKLKQALDVIKNQIPEGTGLDIGEGYVIINSKTSGPQVIELRSTKK
jgi:hypothetical protein